MIYFFLKSAETLLVSSFSKRKQLPVIPDLSLRQLEFLFKRNHLQTALKQSFRRNLLSNYQPILLECLFNNFFVSRRRLNVHSHRKAVLLYANFRTNVRMFLSQYFPKVREDTNTSLIIFMRELNRFFDSLIKFTIIIEVCCSLCDGERTIAARNS